MKNIISIFLLFCLCIPVWATFSWLHYKKYKIKKQVKWQILNTSSDDDLVLLKFSIRDAKRLLTWEHNREFEYQQKMYDVVRQKQIQDTIYYWCFHDIQETQLTQKIKQITLIALQQDSSQQSQQKHLLQWFDTPFNQNSQVWFSYILLLEMKISMITYINLYSFEYSSPVYSPPKKMI